MRLALVFALCACNRVFGISDKVHERDARQFDAPIDAPFQCPTIGTPPQFSPVFHEDFTQDCGFYSTSVTAGIAVALCSHDGMDFPRVYSGPIDQPLLPVAEIPSVSSTFSVDAPRISPEGDLLFVTTLDLDTVVSEQRVYVANPDGSWTKGPDLPVPPYGLVSAPSRGLDRHLINYANGPPTEWSDHGTGAWSAGATIDLGTMPVRNVWFAADGLRLIATIGDNGTATTQLVYADRAAIADSFSPPVPLSSIPSTFDPFITDDCARVYVSSVHAIFYAYQQ